MAHATSRPPKTVQDYLALPDGVRAELIRGEIYVTPAPTPFHQQVGSRIWRRLEAWCRGARSGAAFVPPIDVYLPSGDVVQPDVLLVLSSHREIVQDAVRGVPDLVVEVLSRTHPERDRLAKFALYAEIGVPEYWIADPAASSIEVFRLADGSYRPAGWFRSGEILVTDSLPGFSLPLDEVFAPIFD